jgi:hypothetical protein
MADLVVNRPIAVRGALSAAPLLCSPSMMEGRIDTARFDGQQLALAESALAPVFAVPERDNTVVDAAHRFVAHRGAWASSSRLA